MSLITRIRNLFTGHKTEPEPVPEGEHWERAVLQRIALEGLAEQRKARHWSLFFKLFFVAYLVLLLILAQFSGDAERIPSGEHTALIELSGTIAPNQPASADNLVGALRHAFKSNAKAIIIRANSGGGSAVQSAYVRDEIVRLRKLHQNKKLYAVISDVCASGCYYIISAADRIYANKSSLVGSIGVIMGGFGFTEAMKKLGIERRVFTAGENKAMLDPFQPLRPVDKRNMQKILKGVHEEFIRVVKEGRGDALKPTSDMFSGRIWEGITAQKIGLVDEFGSSSYVAREVVGAEKLVDYTIRENWLDRLSGGRLGTSIGSAIASRVEEPGLTGLK